MKKKSSPSTLGNSKVGIKQGFTLIELMVAIAIIAILASFLLPLLGKARKTARRAVCTSNFKQCGIAVISYANDHKGTMPKAIQDYSPDYYKNYSDLRTLLGPYLSDSFSVWMCPSVPTSLPIDDPRNTGNKPRGNYNYYPGHNKVEDTSVKITANGSADILMSDLAYQWNNKWRANHSIGGTSWTPYPNNPSLTSFANGFPEGANGLYADGHVSWCKKMRWAGNTSGANHFFVPVE
ncbi:prepilin-type N-terminal cleavage/methylation domain-containing protein [Lentisphaera profundi]|uniref:Prepilin-type N-terminal cleavage/methylation domain-containing protein n=1 Tax=Lentisphaera profundi TaxID=1658616 RepID=A0ABY7VUP8_9BACT|nr:prepilin-type N-terminal cleavage/methylation domain-containing protein [Lentisphaera profundi]WDE96474.1 prepilin-type N-terminal cleavage/methylation domain-containing protein [Lentisphaera profundi]